MDAQLKVKSYTYWDLFLHENQCYLGRTFALLKDDNGIDDFLAIDGAVRDEFFLVGRQFKTAVQALFHPDKMNYAALSNTSPAIHVHLVPRYREPREFAGKVFVDQRWGKNYAPYDRTFVLDSAVLVQIRDALSGHLR